MGNSSRTFERKGSADDVQDLTGRKKGAQFVYRGGSRFLFFFFFRNLLVSLGRDREGRAVKRELCGCVSLEDLDNSNQKNEEKRRKKDSCFVSAPKGHLSTCILSLGRVPLGLPLSHIHNVVGLGVGLGGGGGGRRSGCRMPDAGCCITAGAAAVTPVCL